MTLPPPVPPTPGWYDDPEEPGSLRYFDGILWSAHVVSKGPAPVEPVAPVPATSPQAPPVPPAAPPSTPRAPGRRQGASASVDGRPYATYGQRVLAFLVDGAIKIVLDLVLAGWAFYLAFRPQMDAMVTAARNGTTVPPFDVGAGDARWLSAYVLLVAVVGLTYSTVFLVRRGATPGKLAVGIRVRPLGHDGRVDVAMAVRRYLIPFAATALSFVPLLATLLAFLWAADHAMPLLDPRRQALHDRMAGTEVVSSRRSPWS